MNTSFKYILKESGYAYAIVALLFFVAGIDVTMWELYAILVPTVILVEYRDFGKK